MKQICRLSSLGLFVLLLLTPVVRAESVCGSIRDALPIGASVPKQLMDVLHDVRQVKEIDIDVLKIPALKAQATQWQQKEFGHTEWPLQVQWIVPGRIGMEYSIGGTMNCQDVQFFEINGTVVKPIASPPGFDVKDACWNESLHIDMIGKQPYLVQTLGNGWLAYKLQAIPWQKDGWGKGCNIAVQQSVELEVEGRSCSPVADCSNLERQALAQARIRQKSMIDGEFPNPIGVAEQSSKDSLLQDGYGKFPTDQLPKLTSEAYQGFPYTELTDKQRFTITNMPNLIGIIGQGNFGWRTYDGWLVGFWTRHEHDQTLEPLAGFQIRRTNGMVKSTKVSE